MYISGPVYVMVLEKTNAIAEWRDLIGPTDAGKAKITHPNSIRAMCGLDLERNCVHGSDAPQSAAKEISFFFREAFSAACNIDMGTCVGVRHGYEVLDTAS
ncbi:hypothetical protein GIB67_026505 [Kingdonia uniflora]|uniref:Nucleoside diphosphate kinase n=1 Tax=Kingdonia uniflora TaxID=39325 RepID=A0A7J7PC95_9MAGN|nr:hypothetical protein GIB67_026505 [Kingdonia uniflora]